MVHDARLVALVAGAHPARPLVVGSSWAGRQVRGEEDPRWLAVAHEAIEHAGDLRLGSVGPDRPRQEEIEAHPEDRRVEVGIVIEARSLGLLDSWFEEVAP